MRENPIWLIGLLFVWAKIDGEIDIKFSTLLIGLSLVNGARDLLPREFLWK